MGRTDVKKTTKELQREIDELCRQQREITERMRDPRGLHYGILSGIGPCNFAVIGSRQRGFLRLIDRTDVEDQPPAKRRLSSAVVKIEDGEIVDDEVAKDFSDMAFEGSGAVDKMAPMI